MDQRSPGEILSCLRAPLATHPTACRAYRLTISCGAWTDSYRRRGTLAGGARPQARGADADRDGHPGCHTKGPASGGLSPLGGRTYRREREGRARPRVGTQQNTEHSMTTRVSRAQTVAELTAAAHTVDALKIHGRNGTEPPDQVRSERNPLRRGQHAPRTRDETQTRGPCGPSSLEVSG
jgi:hypothetical protein